MTVSTTLATSEPTSEGDRAVPVAAVSERLALPLQAYVSSLKGATFIAGNGERLAFRIENEDPAELRFELHPDDPAKASILFQRQGLPPFCVLSGQKDEVARAFAVATRQFRPSSRSERFADFRNAAFMGMGALSVFLLILGFLTSGILIFVPFAAVAAVTGAFMMLRADLFVDLEGATSDPETRTY
jgi:hypothetical protein